MLPLPIDGACDSHVHIVGPVERFPQVAGRGYTAAEASLDSLRAVAEPSGATRFVVVQPSFYGTDNTCLFAALEVLGERGRGIAGINVKAATPSLLVQYERLGVCGVRLNAYSPAGAAATGNLVDALTAWTENLPSVGWHIEIVAPLPALLSAEFAIARSPVPIVVDHYGLPGDVLPGSREGRRLLELVGFPHVWMKVSAPYRTGDDPLATVPPTVWLHALLRAAPDRCLWGSDWPHTPAHQDQKGEHGKTPYRRIEYARLLRDFVGAVADEALTRSVLIENPGRLYGFPQS